MSIITRSRAERPTAVRAFAHFTSVAAALPWPIIFITAFGATLRLYHLTALSLWTDEGFTVSFSRQPWLTVLGFGELYSAHPPFYYLLVKTIALVTPDAIAGRALSFVVGTLTIPVLYILVVWLSSRRAAFLASFALAISPLHIWYSQTGRMYVLTTFFVLLSYLALVGFYRAPRRRWSILYGVALACAVYTDYSAIYSLVPQLLILLVLTKQYRRRALGPWIAGIIAALSYMPWLSRLRATLDWVGDSRLGLDPSIDHVKVTILSLVGLGGNASYFFGSQPTSWERWERWHSVMLLCVGLIIIVGSVALIRRTFLVSLVVVGLLPGTIVVSMLLSLLSPGYAERTILAAVVGWSILIGLVIDQRLPRWVIAVGLFSAITLLSLSAVTLDAIYRGSQVEHRREVATDVAIVAPFGYPILVQDTVTHDLIDIYQPQIFETNSVQQIDDALGHSLLPGRNLPGALWVVYSDHGGPFGQAYQQRLKGLGYERVFTKYYWHPLYLDLYALPGVDLGKNLSINGQFAGSQREATGWQSAAEGVEYDDDGGTQRRLTITTTTATGLHNASRLVPATVNSLYTLTLSAQTHLSEGSARIFLICTDAQGAWTGLAPDGAGLPVVNDGDWHDIRFAVLCPERTTKLQVELRNSGVGAVSFRNVVLQEQISLGANFLPALTGASVSSGDDRWLLGAGATVEPAQQSFRIVGQGTSTNVTLTTRRIVPGSAYLFQFRYRNIQLAGEQRVFISAQGNDGNWIDVFPDGAGFLCEVTPDWRDGEFTFTVPSGTKSLTIWLRVNGSGEAEYTQVELRKVG